MTLSEKPLTLSTPTKMRKKKLFEFLKIWLVLIFYVYYIIRQLYKHILYITTEIVNKNDVYKIIKKKSAHEVEVRRILKLWPLT